MYFSTITVFLLCKSITAVPSLHILSDEFIEEINNKQKIWTAGRNFPVEKGKEYFKTLTGKVITPNEAIIPSREEYDDEFIASLPEKFDAREKWPNCPSIKEIGDNGDCALNWASAITATMTDRICIHTNGTQKVHLSATDLLGCCTPNCADGCYSIIPVAAWEYWEKKGIVTGGDYGSNEGCKPYVFEPCSHIGTGTLQPCIANITSPGCEKKCIKGYNTLYEKDLHFGKNVTVIKQNEEQTRAEIFKNGPVQSYMFVYDDFFNYKSGVYRYVAGDVADIIFVKILGWGEENSVKYWLVANFWSTEFGDKGFFKIVRGENHCFIEHLVLGGLPA